MQYCTKTQVQIQTKRYLSRYQEEGLVLAKEQGGSSRCQQSITWLAWQSNKQSNMIQHFKHTMNSSSHMKSTNHAIALQHLQWLFDINITTSQWPTNKLWQLIHTWQPALNDKTNPQWAPTNPENYNSSQNWIKSAIWRAWHLPHSITFEPSLSNSLRCVGKTVKTMWKWSFKEIISYFCTKSS